jgi:hypothetical protein
LRIEAMLDCAAVFRARLLISMGLFAALGPAEVGMRRGRRRKKTAHATARDPACEPWFLRASCAPVFLCWQVPQRVATRPPSIVTVSHCIALQLRVIAFFAKGSCVYRFPNQGWLSACDFNIPGNKEGKQNGMSTT